MGISVCMALPIWSRGMLFPYRNPELPIEERVEDLLSRMTLEEKLALVDYTVANLTL